MIKSEKEHKRKNSTENTASSGVGLMPPALFGDTQHQKSSTGSNTAGNNTPTKAFEVARNEKIEDSAAFIAPNNTEDKIHYNDVVQGQIADCFLASSLATVALQNPKLIENAITPPTTEGGDYKVKLFKKSSFLGSESEYEQKEYSVSPAFAIAKKAKKGGTREVNAHMGIGDKRDGKKEIWPILIERAYAMMIADGDVNTGIEKLNNGGDAALVLEALSGKSSTGVNADEVTLASLQEFLTTKQGVVFNALGKGQGKGKKLYETGKLVEWHAYYLIRVDEKKKIVTLGNPWGKGRKVRIPFEDVKDSFNSIRTNKL